MAVVEEEAQGECRRLSDSAAVGQIGEADAATVATGAFPAVVRVGPAPAATSPSGSTVTSRLSCA